MCVGPGRRMRVLGRASQVPQCYKASRASIGFKSTRRLDMSLAKPRRTTHAKPTGSAPDRHVSHHAFDAECKGASSLYA
jgi:hypothetical protein